MRETFLNIKNQLKNRFGGRTEDAASDSANESEYVEISNGDHTGKDKARVQQFVLLDFDGVKPVIDALRLGNTIALVNIKPLKERDLVELKRAISKIKKTCDALGGDVAGFGEDYVVATPEFAYIYREKGAPAQPRQEQPQGFSDDLPEEF